MLIEFHPAAAKHGIGRDRVRYVIDHCACPLYPTAAHDEDLVVFLGPDARGVPLEVVAVELAGDRLLVIHAMRLRRKYSDEYALVTGCQ